MAYERVEVITSVERRRRWSAQDKLRLVGESYRAAGGVGEVAARADLHPSLLQRWRREIREGRLAPDRLGPGSFVPIVIGTAEGAAAPISTEPVAGPPRGAVHGLVEIDLPNGCRVRVEQDIPMAALRRIIGALVRR
ncbi:MAG: transposase [Geminicoccaceae bacterium]